VVYAAFVPAVTRAYQGVPPPNLNGKEGVDGSRRQRASEKALETASLPFPHGDDSGRVGAECQHELVWRTSDAPFEDVQPRTYR
jgi:hypothetical protein